MTDRARDAAARLLGVPATGSGSLGGATRVDLADGRTVVVKGGPGVAAEAAGLAWLAVPGAPGVPPVLAADTSWLVTGYVEVGHGPVDDAPERFGRALAALHAAGAPAFGSPPPGGPADAWIGTAPMRNRPAHDWATWYAEDRIAPYVASAHDAGTLDRADVALVERLCERLPGLAGPAGACLIDPAAHGGHRETDLAMLALFGLPGLDRVLAAYDDVTPPAPGRPDRVALQQVFPLLVHVVLFGGGYRGQALAAVRTALRGG